MFELDWGKLVIIGIVALIAIGPKELPGVLRTLGQYMAKIRRMAAEFQGQFQEAMREAEMADLKKQANDMTASVSDIANFDPMAHAKKEMEAAFNPEPAKSAMSSAEPAADVAAAAVGAPQPAAMVAHEAPELPKIDVPMPELPPPVTEKDFNVAETPAAKEPEKQAGSGG